MRFSTAELADGLGGVLNGADVAVEGASIDSRTIAPGQLFVPIVAERDGHRFIDAALDAGAAAYLTSEPPQRGNAIRVGDTSRALTEMGAFARRRMVGEVVGITGSVGKTTTKDLLAGVLASTFRTAASARSLNNELGVPLTLCGAPDDVEWVVIEMGARRVGHITELTDLAHPRVGIVTRVGMAHIEFFGDLEGVAQAKGELVSSLPTNGVAVLNVDDDRVADMASLARCPVITYGLGEGAEVRASAVSLGDDLRSRFTLSSPWGGGEVMLRLRGEAQVSNALAAAAAALWVGVAPEAIVAALGEVTGSSLRIDVRRLAQGPALIIDCYNANPMSTSAALQELGRLGRGQKVALLGPMAELGAQSADEHRAIAALARQLGVRVVGYRTDLYGSEQVETVAHAVDLVRSLGSADTLLIKGSRVARLEEVVAAYGEAIGEPLRIA